MSTDPFAKAAARIVKRMGQSCIFVRSSTSERIQTYAVLDEEVEIVDELGNLVDRNDVIALIVAEVGKPKNGDSVIFNESGATYLLGRNVRDDGYVSKMMATKDG